MRVVYTKYWKDINKARTKLTYKHTFTHLHTNKTHIQSRYKNHYVNHPQISQSIQSTSYRSIRTLTHKLSPAIYKHILMHAHAGNASIRTAFSSLFLICWETRKKNRRNKWIQLWSTHKRVLFDFPWELLIIRYTHLLWLSILIWESDDFD